MNVEERRTFLRYVFKRMKDLHHRMTVYRVVIQVMEDEGFSASRVKVLLEQARNSPEIQAETDKAFCRFDELIEQASESAPEEALSALLQNWNPPDGEPN